MGSSYTIFGKQVQPHILSILTLGSVAAVALWPRAKAAEKPAAAPADAAPSKEEDFDLEKIIDDLIKEET